ncbi:unnamed protein product, partial [Prunus brigantina]
LLLWWKGKVPHCLSTSQLSLVCERATARNEDSSILSLEWITCAPSY